MPQTFHKKTTIFQVPRNRNLTWKIVLYSGLMTLAILAILPFTQVLSGDPRDRTFREVQVANIPPPEPPPPEPPPPPEEEKQEETPDLDEPPPMLDLSQLEASLNPGIGGAVMAGFDLDAFSSGIDAAGDLDIFDVVDLDRTPRMVKRVIPEYPTELLANRIEGSVSLVLIIDSTGKVTVDRVADWKGDRRFIQPTRLALSQCLFEPPTKDGKAVRARYKITIPFTLP